MKNNETLPNRNWGAARKMKRRTHSNNNTTTRTTHKIKLQEEDRTAET